MHINNMATVETLDNSIQEIVTAALDAGFRVFAHKGNRGPSSFVEACLDTEGSFVTVCTPTHRWDDAGISAPIKPNKVSGSSVLVDYDGTAADAVRAMREVCESPTVSPRFVGRVPDVPNYGNKCITTWPGGYAESFVEIVSDTLSNSIEAYAAKFAAESVCNEPPRYVEPTDANLMACLVHCGVKPKPGMLHGIRDTFVRDYAMQISTARR